MNLFNLFKKEPKTPKERAQKFCKKHGLQFLEMNHGYHMRARNPDTGLSVDFWTTGTMETCDGKYSKVGHKGKLLQIELDKLIL